MPVCIAVKAGPSPSRLTASITPVTAVRATISAGMCGGSREPAVAAAFRFSSMTPDSDTPARPSGADMPEGIGSGG
ncbi:hypothetical protein Scinn_29990 [Streptomyces virginiae]|uniref:Uncharacterized protein n=1 Tax=Streptomyces virginiae TaxID=1961 RepID=A0ABQ3NL77_STRVG|nr:hypothetical protein Scinn_29990 [Streptomyces virginiae]